MNLVEDSAIDQPPSEYLKLLYFDSVLHSPELLDNLIRQFGADRIVLGSDYPAGMGNFTPVAALAEVAGLTDARRDAIAHRNPSELFGLSGMPALR